MIPHACKPSSAVSNDLLLCRKRVRRAWSIFRFGISIPFAACLHVSTWIMRKHFKFVHKFPMNRGTHILRSWLIHRQVVDLGFQLFTKQIFHNAWLHVIYGITFMFVLFSRQIQICRIYDIWVWAFKPTSFEVA